jgi:hypothetical protein
MFARCTLKCCVVFSTQFATGERVKMALLLIKIFSCVFIGASLCYGWQRLRAFHIRCNWREAFGEFWEWRQRNPGVFIGLSDEGTRLLRKTYAAYEAFLWAHPDAPDTGHREELLKYLDDFPPDTPQGARPAVFAGFFMQNVRYDQNYI